MLFLKIFKDLNYELEIIGANILFRKTILLKSVKILYKTINALKTSNKYF